MIRGKIPFRCTNCHKIFIDMDIEWGATVFSVPMKCPKCGSKRTLPLLASKHEYESIWKARDEND